MIYQDEQDAIALVDFYRDNIAAERNKPFRPAFEVVTEVQQFSAPRRRERRPPQQPDFVSGATLNVPIKITSINPTSGPKSGGDTTTIYGQGFVTGLTVKFDGVLQTLTPGSVSSDGTNILFVTVAGTAGPVDVKVTNPDGASDTLTDGYTYNDGPHITSVDPASGTTAGGMVVTVHGTGFLNGTGLTLYFGSLPATLVSASSDGTLLYGYTPAHAAGPVNVKATNPDGQFDELVNGYTYGSVAVAYFKLIPLVITNGVVTSMVIQAWDSDPSLGGSKVSSYTGSPIMTFDGPNDGSMAVGTIPALGNAIPFTGGEADIQIQAVSAYGSGQYSGYLRFIDSVNSINTTGTFELFVG